MPNFENSVKDIITRTDQAPLGLYTDVKEVSSDTTADVGDIVIVDASSSGVTITLPQPDDNMLVTVKKIDSSNNVVTVETPGSQEIDGVSSLTISNQFVSEQITSVNGKYFLV